MATAIVIEGWKKIRKAIIQNKTKLRTSGLIGLSGEGVNGGRKVGWAGLSNLGLETDGEELWAVGLWRAGDETWEKCPGLPTGRGGEMMRLSL